MINEMIFRVFLQDERDVFDSSTDNAYKIRVCEMSLSCFTGFWMPSLAEQIRASRPGSTVYPHPEQVGGHWIIMHGSSPVGIAHEPSHVPPLAYQIAREKAQQLAEDLSKRKGRRFVFIDVTSNGDAGLAERLSQQVQDVYVSAASPRAADIGD
ncbi:MAG: hypothetical protein V1659_04650 [Candidatus Woesearchaeota archaeon]